MRQGALSFVALWISMAVVPVNKIVRPEPIKWEQKHHPRLQFTKLCSVYSLSFQSMCSFSFVILLGLWYCWKAVFHKDCSSLYSQISINDVLSQVKGIISRWSILSFLLLVILVMKPPQLCQLNSLLITYYSTFLLRNRDLSLVICSILFNTWHVSQVRLIHLKKCFLRLVAIELAA